MPDPAAEHGIGWVMLSRALPNGTVAVASFLVDHFCLGVKDAHAEILPRMIYDSKYVRGMRVKVPVRDGRPADARKFVEEAVVYAHGLGFRPHPDYDRAKILFGEVDASQSKATFEFGQDGKPYFVSGPNDTPERIRQILATLNHSCGGPDHYHFLVAMDPNGPPPFPGAEGGKFRIIMEDEDFDEDEN